MKNKFTYYLILASIVLMTSFNACKKDTKEIQPDPPKTVPPVVPPTPAPSLATIKTWLVDKNATNETAALFYNMKTLAKTKTMFGHQDDTFQGYGWEREAGRSDVKEVTGSLPAVYGWDFLNITSFQKNSWFTQYASDIKSRVIDAYNQGGVNTFSWHYWNPVASEEAGNGNEGKNADFYFKNAPYQAVDKILPGGEKHEVFKRSLDEIAEFTKNLKTADGTLIPIIFRPFHELDGDWFWWGNPYCTEQQYIDLYRFTVTYLRDIKGVRNMLFSWSPDNRFSSEASYLTRYPGDDYVDVLGTDNYGDLSTGNTPITANNKLKIVSDYAISKNKIAAFTETGLNKIPQVDWFTQMLLKVLTTKKVEIAYVLLWGNRTDSYYVPYVGHAASNDFKDFKANSYIVFGDNIPKMYTLN
jgi:mannan endo-1,4-beta-mannosidase